MKIDGIKILGKCEDSECPNDAYFVLTNGEEKEILCDQCFQEALLDLVVSNGGIHITESDIEENHYILL